MATLMGAAAAAAAGGGQQAAAAGGPAGLGLPQKGEMSTMLQQLNLESIRTRDQDLFTAISSIIQSFQTIPHHKWPDVLSQFSMVNVELLNLVEDVKPILKMFVVHPKNVNAENAPILPIMLSSKLLPEMESEEAALRDQILAGVSNLPLQLQTEKLQKQIEMVKKACEIAEKALADNRKLYGLGSRQVPAHIPPLDKALAAKIAEQEKLLRAAVNMGEGLRLPPSERQQPASLPAHLVAALQSADGGPGASKGLALPQPGAMGTLGGISQQQVAAAQMLVRNVPSPMPMIGGGALDASPMFANSPRSSATIINDASAQQQSLLQRQKVQQMQKQQQMQQQQQQQPQLRQPATPPIGQTHFQQLQQAQLQQLQLHERHHLQMQMQQQARLQQQQQQLQSNSLQQGLGQNQLVQAAGQVKPSHMGPMGNNSAGSLFGNTQMSSNMMANLGANMQPQATMLQQRLQHLGGVGMGATGQPQRTLPSQLLADPLYNVGLAGSQGNANLGLPLQQQLVGQSNFNNILNPNQNLNFGQQRQPPPSQ